MPFPDFDPVLLQIGPFAIRWYALAYVAGILVGWRYVAGLMKKPALWGPRGAPATPAQVDDLVLWITLGVILGVFVVILAAYSLVLDFDFIQKGVNNKAPRKYGWTGAFGIMATVIWLYLEILRMLAIARR